MHEEELLLWALDQAAKAARLRPIDNMQLSITSSGILVILVTTEGQDQGQHLIGCDGSCARAVVRDPRNQRQLWVNPIISNSIN